VKIWIIHFGKFKSATYEKKFEEYLKLTSKYVECKSVFLPLKKSKSPSDTLREWLDKQSTRITFILLDERGSHFTSRDFSKKIQTIQDSGVPNWIIACGSEHGFDEELKIKSSFLLSLSSMTFAHELAMVVLSEQLYRAHTIIKGHPYHNE
jgi:23S rRNA (pseudouridine1915-N3)-methyltransferase